MTKISLTCCLPCCRSINHGEQTKASKFLRISAIAIGVIAVVVGILILKNTVALGLLSTAVVGGPLIAAGLVIILAAVFFKCIKVPSNANSNIPQHIVSPNPTFVNPNPSWPNPVWVESLNNLSKMLEPVINQGWQSMQSEFQDLTDDEIPLVFDLAIKNGEFLIVQGILEKDSSLLSKTHSSSGDVYAPLFWAISNSDSNKALATAQVILSYDNDQINRTILGKTVLHQAMASSSVSIELVQLLIEHHANVNAQDNKGNTPLHILVSQPNFANTVLFQFLINSEADLHLANNQGTTVFDLVQHKAWFLQMSQAQ